MDKMTIRKARQSTPDQSPDPQATSNVSLVTAALILTIIVMQVQDSLQGSSRDLLAILVAAVLAVIGGTPHPPES